MSWDHLTGVEELVLYRSWWTSFALEALPALREIYVQRVDLDDKFDMESYLVEEIAGGLRQRDRAARYRPDKHFEPVQRIVLENCTGVEEFVDILKDMLEIVIVR